MYKTLHLHYSSLEDCMHILLCEGQQMFSSQYIYWQGIPVGTRIVVTPMKFDVLHILALQIVHIVVSQYLQMISLFGCSPA